MLNLRHHELERFVDSNERIESIIAQKHYLQCDIMGNLGSCPQVVPHFSHTRSITWHMGLLRE